MTFRPTDDILDEVTNNQGSPGSFEQNNIGQIGGQSMFNRFEDSNNNGVVENNGVDMRYVNISTEEVKAPDLSELLKNDDNTVVENNTPMNEPLVQNGGILNDKVENQVNETENLSVNNAISGNSVISENNVILENNVTLGNNVISENNAISGNSVVSESNVTPGNSVVSESNVIPGNSVVSESNVTPGNSVVSESNVTPGNNVVSESNVTPENNVIPGNNQLSNQNTQVNPVNVVEHYPVDRDVYNVISDEVKQEGEVKQEDGMKQENVDYYDENKLSDKERVDIVSGIEGSVHSNLDFLVDNDWLSVIKKYKFLNRLFFRWGIYVFAVVMGILAGVLLQVKASNQSSLALINDSSIENKSKWVEDTSDVVLGQLVDSGVDINVIVPYGTVVLDGSSFQSKSNLVSYNGIILPQLSSVDYKEKDFISLADFSTQKISRNDIENLIKSLITNDSIYKKTRNLPNVEDSRWVGNTFQSSLLEGFNLGCLNSNKVSDFVCDKFVQSFNKYGKYYDLVLYASDILDLIKQFRNQSKDIKPICNMVNEYVLRAGRTSDVFDSIMSYCDEQDSKFYRKMSKFIELENSLKQPELSDKVFDDPDLNAYKLLSAQQNVYKIVDGTSLNEGYIKSYLSFVQNLIIEDKGSNTYLLPIYKDILYVFNMDELNKKLQQKGILSSDIKTQIKQINNGNTSYGYPALVSQLTTSDLIEQDTGVAENEIVVMTIDELFSQYYTMTNRLKIRRVSPVSEEQIRVQTELLSDKVLSATNGEPLKLTVMLNRQDNLLYVDNIKVVNQKNLTDILNIHAAEGVTFNAMLNYIEEQVGMWYDSEPVDVEPQPTLCEQIQERDDITIYTCDDVSILLYKGDVEYSFTLENGILFSFAISDEKLDSLIKSKLEGVMFMRDDTPAIITSIIDFSIETPNGSIEKKLDIFDQFRIHFKLVPDDVHDIEGETEEFLVDLTLGTLKLQAHYNTDTRLLSEISYVACDKTLRIKNLTIEITTENEPQLMEILNNPEVFFAQANAAAYKKYQKMCK